MPKSKKRIKKSATQTTHKVAPINLSMATDDEINGYLKQLEKRTYDHRWGMKHSIFEVNEWGSILNRISFAYSTNWKEVLANLMVRPDTFALVMMSEAWSTTSMVPRASLAKDRKEVRLIEYLDLNRNSIGIHHFRDNNSYLEGGKSLGTGVDLMADALGIVQKIDDIILARTFLHSLAMSFMDLDVDEREDARTKLENILSKPDSLDIFAKDFTEMACDVWSHLGNDPREEAPAVRHLFSNLPLAPGEELEIEVSAVLTPGFSLPKWVGFGQLAA